MQSPLFSKLFILIFPILGMGLQISEIVPKQEITFEKLQGRVVAVDSFNMIYQFLANIRQPDGTPLQDSRGRITSHLSGLFYRTTNLIQKGLKLVFVFDGKSSKLKIVRKERESRKQEAQEKYEEAKKKGRKEDMLKYSRQTIKITDEIIDESKELIDALGFPVIQAPGEGEAQAAFMVRQGDAWAVASQDYDSLLFGSPRLLQNLTLARKRRLPSGAFTTIQPEIIELQQVLNSLQLTQEQLISLGILIGTDFNPGGVKGIGPKKALQLVTRYRQPVLIFNSVQRQLANESKELEFDWQEIFEFFKKPDVIKNYDLKFKNLNEKEVKKILIEHDFSEERVTSALAKIKETKSKGQQTGLHKFF